MYVSELDRPWLDTPFLFQGFRITNQQEIEQIKGLCDFVFVDMEKSTVPIPNTMFDAALPRSKPQKQNYAKIIKAPLPYTESFEDEVGRAWHCYQQATQQVSSLFDDVKMGRSLQVAGARATVSAMVGSILRHPDALVLLASLGNRDRSLVNHALSVCTLSLAFGRFLGFDKGALLELGLGALLHDIGEVKLLETRPAKAVNASSSENALLERHTVVGAVMLRKLDSVSDNIIAIVHDHHERTDGSGYPRRLTGHAIGVNAKLVSIVDTYDSITSGIHGYETLSVDDALKSIYTWRGTLFDELLVEKFIQCVGVYPLGSVVELRSGQIGIVVSSRPNARLFPSIMLIMDEQRKPLEPPKIVNLALFRAELDSDEFEVRRLVDAGRLGIDVRQYVLREMPLG
jgi:putative nucleotidyltransferase with HDIG domain